MFFLIYSENRTSVSPGHANGTQSERQWDILRPVGHDGREPGPVADGVGPPATTSDNTASHRKGWVFTLDYSAKNKQTNKTWNKRSHFFNIKTQKALNSYIV